MTQIDHSALGNCHNACLPPKRRILPLQNYRYAEEVVAGLPRQAGFENSVRNVQIVIRGANAARTSQIESAERVDSCQRNADPTHAERRNHLCVRIGAARKRHVARYSKLHGYRRSGRCGRTWYLEMNFESPRVLRRLQLLREWSHE